MAKRSKDTLTGGTGDVNPQYACVTLITPALVAADAGAKVVVAPIVLPVMSGMGPGSDMAQVVELLRVKYDFGNLPQISTTQLYTYNSLRLAFNATTAAVGSTSNAGSIGNPLMIDEEAVTTQSENSVLAGAFSQVIEHNNVTDLTDGAGHGILIAVPTIWAGLAISGWPTGGSAFGAIRVLYRVKRVKLIEYIGIVQQQSGPQI